MGVRLGWLVPGGMCHCRFRVVGSTSVRPRVACVCCVCVSFSQPTNYCPEEPAAVATIVFSFTAITLPLPPPPLSLLSVDSRESEGSLSPGSCSHGESLHHCGTLSHTQSNTQLVSSVSFYLSLCHYILQLSLWLSLWASDAHSYEHTHALSSNPNVPSIFVITRSPDGARSIGFCI